VELTRRQRNDVFEALVRNGLDPAESVELFDDQWPVQIRHQPSASMFVVNLGSGPSYLGNAYVGEATFAEFSPCDWDQLIDQVAEWAQEVKYELDTPDLWRELKSSSRVLAELDDESATTAPFTAGEQLQISERLAEIKEYVRRTYEPSEEQMAQIERRFDEAGEASRRIGRKDWKLMFMGTVFGLAANDLVPAGAVHSIFAVLLHGAAHLFGVDGGPPVFPPQA
jgi:hypothetical protein